MNVWTLLCMKRLLARSVAILFSLEGRQEKKKFSDLNLFNVVIGRLHLFPVFLSFTITILTIGNLNVLRVVIAIFNVIGIF